MRASQIQRLLPSICLMLLFAAGHCATAQAAGCATWPNSVLVLRHAERLDRTADSPLSAAGWERSACLPAAVRSLEVSRIFVTELQRTQQTASSLAACTGITPKKIPRRKLNLVIEAVCEAGRQEEKAVVIVGHSTTVAKIMRRLNVSQNRIKALQAMPDEIGFGDLFLIDPENGSVKPSRFGC